ncbi:MAG: hypothetical protein IPK15_16985 [Verrucomicrobia bacterium]|nr:hypothetical protein [Verrucomicrobiota bacterium]
MNAQIQPKRSLWLAALGQRKVWTRAAKIGLPVGCVQSVINQGDVWWHHQATGLTLAKTIISPLVTFSVALASAAATWVEKQRQAAPSEETCSRSSGAAIAINGTMTSTSNPSVPQNEIVQV